jgi:uncharacterized protein (DUF1501 family)
MTITRRAFFKHSGLALLTLGLGPSFLNRAALATAEPGSFRRRKVLVTIFQRGAMDALAAVPPLDEPALAQFRPRLAMSGARRAGEGALIDLNGEFGLHPAFRPLLPWWQDGRLAVVHAVGSPDPTRSHFDAQDYMETGTPGQKGTASGWLNRVSGLLGHDATPFRSVAMTSAMPRSLYGEAPAVAMARLEDFQMRGGGGSPGAAGLGKVGQGFEALYEQTSQELLHDVGGDTFDAMEILREANLTDPAGYRPAAGADYPRSPLGDSLRQIAMLVKAGIGLEVAFAETGGWDTHVQQGTVGGTFANRADDLARSIAAFWADLGTYRDDVVVMTMTEFGRTVRENGSGGTDHGHGSALFVLGNAVDGGKIHGHFDRLTEGFLYEGRDLPVTTDFRAVFSGVARGHLRLPREAELFPGWSGGEMALIT